MLQQEHHAILHLACLDEVVVVEHQHDVDRECVEVVQQRAEDLFDRRLGGLQERERTRPNPGRGRLAR
jgi:hypothetical protein